MAGLRPTLAVAQHIEETFMKTFLLSLVAVGALAVAMPAAAHPHHPIMHHHYHHWHPTPHHHHHH
jgi:hypothetical protein